MNIAELKRINLTYLLYLGGGHPTVEKNCLGILFFKIKFQL